MRLQNTECLYFGKPLHVSGNLMRPANEIILILVVLLFVQCKNSIDATLNQPLDNSYINMKRADAVYGSWTYNFPFYSSELIFSEDSTFRFHNQGCTGHGYTEGVWIRNGDDLVLSSFEKYRRFSSRFDSSNLYFDRLRLKITKIGLIEMENISDNHSQTVYKKTNYR